MSGPVLTILAGSNGSGKSTLTSYGRSKFQDAPILDPDAIARSIQDTMPSESSDMESGRRVLLRAEELITAHQSFTVETTLSGSTYLKMSARAKQAGFKVMVIFVGTAAVEINIERVKARVKKGGHDVLEADQRRRFPRSLANMKRLLSLADFAVFLDNSGSDGHIVVGFGRAGFIQWHEPVPSWAESLKG